MGGYLGNASMENHLESLPHITHAAMKIVETIKLLHRFAPACGVRKINNSPNSSKWKSRIFIRAKNNLEDIVGIREKVSTIRTFLF
jgi:hypothetical protein